ncbi:MAG: hypothetical protein ACK53L_15190, partial [Pirellulaceae bacterium]
FLFRRTTFRVFGDGSRAATGSLVCRGVNPWPEGERIPDRLLIVGSAQVILPWSRRRLFHPPDSPKDRSRNAGQPCVCKEATPVGFTIFLESDDIYEVPFGYLLCPVYGFPDVDLDPRRG